MKKYIILSLTIVSLGLTSCKDYLTEIEPGAELLADFYSSTAAAQQVATGCYVPMIWDWGTQYIPEWFIGDVVSDDALKGGKEVGDMPAVYDFENWKTISTNDYLLNYYRAQYQGIARCNQAIQGISNMPIGIDEKFTVSMKNRLLGEALYLRAFYYFRMLRIFGEVPLITKVIDNSNEWDQERASIPAIFEQITKDLKTANDYLWPVEKFRAESMATTELGRATKGAAQAMLLKTYLYMASPYWNKYLNQDAAFYAKQAEAWGDSIVTSGSYILEPTYFDNFDLAHENNKESVFEMQYSNQIWSSYGGFGFTCGTFSRVLTRSRSSKIGGGWGFNHPTHNLYNEYEAGDPRRDWTILDPESPDVIEEITGKRDSSVIATPSQENYLGSYYVTRKYAMYTDDPQQGGGFGVLSIHDSRGPVNNRQIRYADVLLMRAEAALLNNHTDKAEADLNAVRDRVGMPHFGSYGFAVNGVMKPSPTLEEAIRHERRVELAMEGHRWFDLVRWGNTKAHMDAYKETETPEAQAQMAVFVEGKHERFPIPSDERLLNPKLTQNNGY